MNTVLEVVEARWRYHKATEGMSHARDTLRGDVEAFVILQAAPGLTAPARRDVLHHHAKALRNLGDDAQAIAMCERILAEEGGGPATQILLARLLMRRASGSTKQATDTVRVRDLLIDILERAERAPNEVGMSVILASIEELGREPLDDWAAEITRRFRGLIRSTLVAATARSFPQGLSALAGIGRYLGWNEPDRLAEILTDVSPTYPALARTDSERGSWGDILLAAGQNSGGGARTELLEQALAFYEALERPSTFHLQQKGRTLFELGRMEEAGAVLTPLAAADGKGFARYWLSKVQLAQGDAVSALSLIDEAIDLLGTERRYMAAFLEHRYDVRVALGDPAALEDLRRAHKSARPGRRHELRLAERLTS